MNQTLPWSSPVPNAEAARRAGGRRAYHRQRRLAAELRRTRLLELAERRRLNPLYGDQGRLARALGVHRTTICRDVARLLQESRARQRQT